MQQQRTINCKQDSFGFYVALQATLITLSVTVRLSMPSIYSKSIKKTSNLVESVIWGSTFELNIPVC